MNRITPTYLLGFLVDKLTLFAQATLAAKLKPSYNLMG